jgi:hypothetical protein
MFEEGELPNHDTPTASSIDRAARDMHSVRWRKVAGTLELRCSCIAFWHVRCCSHHVALRDHLKLLRHGDGSYVKAATDKESRFANSPATARSPALQNQKTPTKTPAARLDQLRLMLRDSQTSLQQNPGDVDLQRSVEECQADIYRAQFGAPAGSGSGAGAGARATGSSTKLRSCEVCKKNHKSAAHCRVKLGHTAPPPPRSKKKRKKPNSKNKGARHKANWAAMAHAAICEAGSPEQAGAQCAAQIGE